MICKLCRNEDCTWHGHSDHISDGCLGFERMTNADRIRAMSDKELAEFLCHSVSPSGVANCSACEAADFCYFGHVGWLDWLKTEVEE